MNQNEKFALWQNTLRQYGYKYSEELHQRFKKIFENNIVPITWVPGKNELEASNIASCLKDLGFDNYNQFFSWASLNRENFWDFTIKRLNIVFEESYNKTLDLKTGIETPNWCNNAKLNIVESCLQADPDKTAIIIGSESGQKSIKLSYQDLSNKVNKFASGLLANGYKSGDRIVLYLPFCEEAIIAFLGTIKAGITNVLIADSFTTEELKKRTEISEAKAIITIDKYLYNGKILNTYEKARSIKEVPCIVVGGSGTKLREKDIEFNNFLNIGKDSFTYYKAKPGEYTSILFSSGTTGTPKAIPWTHLTPIKSASDAYYHQNIKEDDIVSWTTGMGWMMAPWLIYASLINKSTLAIYNGAPTSEAFGEFIEKEKITVLGTIPSVVRTWKNKDFHEKFTWNIKLFSSTGEPSNPDEYFYLMGLGKYKAPIIEYCGGTEIGGGYITGSVVQPASPGYFSTPALGLDFELLAPNNSISKAGESCEVYIIPPSIGLSQTLLNKDHHKEYYEGNPKNPQGVQLRKHGDAMERIVEGGFTFYKSTGRTDDTMNLGGIKISAIELEEVLNKHSKVIESAAIAIQTKNGGPEKLMVFVVIKNEYDTEKLHKELQEFISKNLNPLFRINKVKVIEEMPRTASNKILRKDLRKLIE